ncbi:MAG: hypothetical protein K0U64_04845 [Actinomycetia bacterium]|nr:hypothetical protein [Actinomycetes bacterium]
MTRSLAAVLLVGGATLALSVSACSSTSDTSESASPMATTSSSASADPGGNALPSPTFTGANADFCNEFVKIGLAGEDVAKTMQGGDTSAQQQAQAAFDAQLSGLESSLPEDAPTAVQTAVQELKTVPGEDSQTLSGDKLESLMDTLGEYAGKACPTAAPTPAG